MALDSSPASSPLLTQVADSVVLDARCAFLICAFFWFFCGGFPLPLAPLRGGGGLSRSRVASEKARPFPRFMWECVGFFYISPPPTVPLPGPEA